MKKLKQHGYSDAHIAWLMRVDEEEVTRHRKNLGVIRTYKDVDTCPGEYEAESPYYYSTFSEENESKPSFKKKIIVLGFGTNRIGQGFEFDYCCLHCVLDVINAGYESIMFNLNPKTIS